MPTETIIEIIDLTKVYKGADEPAIKDLSLSIAKGEVFGLLGPNGAGKTTTISILCGLFPPTSGSVQVAGKDLKGNEHEIKSIIGVVPQDIALFPTLTAKENLQFIGKMYGLSGEVLDNRITECLDLFELSKNAGKQVGKFSGGMKRRLNLIAGILHEPSILFLDEPTVGVDVQSRGIILNHLKELNGSGTTIIYTSHYMEEAESICTNVAIIDEGKIISIGSPSDLISAHENTGNLEQVFLALTGRHVRD